MYTVKQNSDGRLFLGTAKDPDAYGEFTFSTAMEIAKIMNADLIDEDTGEVYFKRSEEVAARDLVRLGGYNKTQGQGVIEIILFLAIVALVIISALALAGEPVSTSVMNFLTQ